MTGVDLIDLAQTIDIWHYALFKYKLTFILVLCRTANCSYNISFIYTQSDVFRRQQSRELIWETINLRIDLRAMEWAAVLYEIRVSGPVGWPTPHNSFWYAVASGTLGKTFMLEVIVWIQIFWVLQVLYITINYNGKIMRHW